MSHFGARSGKRQRPLSKSSYTICSMERVARKEMAVVWVALLALSFALFLPLAIRPVNGDVALYTYIGQRLLAGDALFIDVWDVKPPGFPLSFALALSLFGGEIWAPAVLEMLLYAAAAVGVFRIAEHYGNRIAAWSASIWLLVALWGASAAGMGMQAESFSLPFLIWAIVLVLTRPATLPKALMTGLLIGAATSIKTPNILYVIPVLFMLRSIASGLVVVFGITIVGSVFVWYLSATGSLSEAVYTLGEFASRFVSERRQPLGSIWSSMSNISGGLYLAAAGTWLGAINLAAKREVRPIAVACALSLLLVLFQSTFYVYHWVGFQAFAAIGVGLFISSLEKDWPRYVRLAPGALVVLGVAPRYPDLIRSTSDFVNVNWGTLSWGEYAAKFPTPYGGPPVSEGELVELAEYVRENSTPEDYIWSAQMPPAISLHARRREAGPYLYFDGTHVQHRRMLEFRSAQADLVISRRPKFIVVCRSYRQIIGGDLDFMDATIKLIPRLEQFLVQEYELVKTIDAAIELYEIRH